MDSTWQMVIVEIEVPSESALVQANVTSTSCVFGTLNQRTRVQLTHGALEGKGGDDSSFIFPRCWSRGYCLNTDTYLDDVAVEFPAPHSHLSSGPDMLMPIVVRHDSGVPSTTSSAAVESGAATSSSSGWDGGFELVMHSLTRKCGSLTPLREGALGRHVYLPVEEPPYSGEVGENFRCDGPTAPTNSHLGRVLAFNSSSGEHFVETFLAASSREEGRWMNLQGFQWLSPQEQEATLPGVHTGLESSYTWQCSRGCWIAVLDDADGCCEDEREGTGVARALALPSLLSQLNSREMKNTPFELPDSLLRDIDQGAPFVVPPLHRQQAQMMAQRQDHDEQTVLQRGDDVSQRTELGVHSDKIEENTCARCRPWSKASHRKQIVNEPESPETASVSLSGNCAAESLTATQLAATDQAFPEVPTFVGARARQSRQDTRRHMRGGAAGSFVTSKRLRFGRSRIEGWGVFTDDFIQKDDPILEYRGVLIGNAMADKKEREYRQEQRDDYQFRMDSDTVVDATTRGSLARYINHSCDPNCFTKIVEYVPVGDKKTKKIVVCSKKVIMPGEELKYDYKFSRAEENEERLPCFCGASNCKRYMN
jgi:hypothetical protein